MAEVTFQAKVLGEKEVIILSDMPREAELAIKIADDEYATLSREALCDLVAKCHKVMQQKPQAVEPTEAQGAKYRSRRKGASGAVAAAAGG